MLARSGVTWLLALVSRYHEAEVDVVLSLAKLAVGRLRIVDGSQLGHWDGR